LALNAGWDNELLAIELSDLQDMGYDLSLTGFNEDEIRLIQSDFEPDAIDEIDEVNESVNFIIKCKNIAEKEIIKEKLNTTSEKIEFKTFMDFLNG